MSDSTALARAIALAADIHADQVDKGGEPYILHCMRVMEGAMEHCDGLWFVGIVAILHDSIEDTEKYTPHAVADMIMSGFGSDVLNMVQVLTKGPNEDYFDYIGRVKRYCHLDHYWAREIKLADLRDNMTILRQPTLTDNDMLRIQKYHMAYRILDQRYT